MKISKAELKAVGQGAVATAKQTALQKTAKYVTKLINFRAAKMANYHEHAFKEVETVAVRHDVPNDATVPADLQDVEGTFWRGKDGFRVAARHLVEDFVTGSKSTAEPFVAWLGLPVAFFCINGSLPLLAFALAYLWAAAVTLEMGGVYTFFLAASGIADFLLHLNSQVVLSLPFGIGNYLATFAMTMPRVLAIIGIVVYTKNLKKNDRFLKLAKQGAMMTAESVTQIGHDAHVKARQMQVENAKRDTTPFVFLGYSTGKVFNVCRDPFAPSSAGMSMGITTNEMHTHTLFTGGTGSGKTTGGIIPMAIQWVMHKAGGLAVFDGKGALPFEMLEFLKDFGYRCIDPRNPQDVISLTEGLKPVDLVNALMKNTSEDSKADYWKTEGERFFLMAATILYEAAQVSKILKDGYVQWIFKGIERVLTDAEYRNWAISYIQANHADCGKGGLLDQAVLMWLNEYPVMNATTSQSHISTAMSYVKKIMLDETLSQWASAETGVDPTAVLRGGLIGFNLGGFGEAGQAVARIIIERIEKEAKTRPANWRKNPDFKEHTSVAFFIDECHLVIGNGTKDMISIARSLGIAYVMATQSVDNFYDLYKTHHAAEAFLNNFRNLITLTSTSATIDYISRRIGAIEKVRPTNKDIMGIDYMREIKIMAENGVNDETHLLHPIFSELNKKGALNQVKDLLKKAGVDHVTGVEMELVQEPVITPAFASVLLQTPFHAIAVLNRGGVQRRDFMELKPVWDINEYMAELAKKGA